MATVAPDVLLECTGFQVVGADGTIGRVDEAWLGPDDEPAAVAVRRLDGQRSLLLALDVETVDTRNERVQVRPGSRLLELSGELPLALHPASVQEHDPSMLRTVAWFLPALAFLIAFEIALMFTVAYLVTGRAY